MNDKYDPCPCGSGKKFKFCCYEKGATLGSLSEEALARRAAEFPVDQCFISRDWNDRGLAQVVVVRQLPDGMSLIGAYLVDVFCLGIKDAFVKRLKPGEIPNFLNCFLDPMQEMFYEDARSVILGAVEFAMRVGLSPDESWLAARSIVESDRPFDRKFSFGKDGKPFYIQGPHDDAPRIMKQLAPLISQGNAHYLCSDDFFADDLTDEPDEEIQFEAWCEDISYLLEEDQLEDAKMEIDDILEDYPERWEPLYLRATCLLLEGDAEQAISLFDRVITMQPSAEAYFNLANAHRSLFHIKEWIACLKKVIELDGRKGDLRKSAKADMDQFASAVRKSDDLSLDQYFETGNIFDRAFEDLNAGRFGDAVAGFSDVLKSLPRHVQSYGNLGLAYAGLGDRDRAFECLEQAIDLDPNYLPAIDNRCILREQPPNQPLIVEPMRRVDFYGDRARARPAERPITMRAVSR